MKQPIKILVTGANGQVGHELLFALQGGAQDPNPHPALRATLSRGERELGVNPSPSGRGVWVRDREIIPATRNGECAFPLPLGEGAPEGRVRVRPCEVLDLADLGGMTAALDRIAPDLILNAAAYTAVDKAEDEPDLAQRINGDAVGAIGAWAARHGARVVHYSTDYVFDGSARRPYRENDAPHPVSVYGRSKLAGEQSLRDSGARYLIFRTAWVYAARGKNFLRAMLRLGAERDELRVVDDQVGAPTPARLIADVTVQALAQWLDDATPVRDGVYHLVATGQVSWCGFARAIFERVTASGDNSGKAHPPRSPFLRKGEENHTPFETKGVDAQHRGDARAQRGGMISPAPRVIAITTADYPTKAARPAYSVLDTARLRTTFDVALPTWQDGLQHVIAELTDVK